MGIGSEHVMLIDQQVTKGNIRCESCRGGMDRK